jgi:hypothetical protein
VEGRINMLKSLFIKNEYKLSENPFPTSIVSWGSKNVKENGSIYNRDVRKTKTKEFIDRLVYNSLVGGLKFGFLWSLGGPSYTRGFGKTATLLYFANWINRDFGASVMSEMGFSEEEIQQNKAVAVYSSFDETRVTSFNYALFNTIKYANDEGVLHKVYKLLCQRAIDELKLKIKASDVLDGEANTDDVLAINESIFKSIEKERARVGGRTLPFKGDFAVDLLTNLENADDVRMYLDSLSEYHRIRNGMLFFDVLLEIFLTAGIKHVFVFLDQIEYVIRSGTRAKLSKETARYRDYAMEIQPSADSTSFVITLHPTAGERISQFWQEARLPDFDYSLPINKNYVVILDELSEDEGKKLIETYLEHFRLPDFAGGNTFHPFTEEAIEELVRAMRGHPSFIIRNANLLLDIAAEKNLADIDIEFVQANLQAELPEAEQ